MNSMLRLRGQIMPALLPIRARFISWRAGTIDAQGIQKVPCDAEGRSIDANDPQYWVDFETAMRRPWGIGLVLGNGIVAVDLDACYEGGALKAIAADAWQALGALGAYCERSISGHGLHLIFEAVLPVGHAVKRGRASGLEVYSSRRFLALGDYIGGDARRDLTGPLMALMERHGLPLVPVARVEVEAGRDPAWSGPEDDAELIGLMLAQGRRGGRMFAADAVTVAELWNCDVAALVRRWPAEGRPDKCPYDRSMADAAMMAELSYFTGRDQARMVRLFERWPGYRPEHYEGKGAYRLSRVLGLGVQNARVYQARSQVPAATVTGAVPVVEGQLGDFLAYLPSNTFYHRPTGKYWPPKSVDNVCPPVVIGLKPGGVGNQTIPATKWLAKNAPVHEVTWMPGAPEIIEDYVLRGGVWRHKPGVRSLNTYDVPMPPQPRGGGCEIWLNHVRTVYPNEAEHILDWMAFASQNAGIKINYAIVLGGAPGLGKDSMLKPLRRVVGESNYQETKPETIITEKYNPYLLCRILRINEAKDTGGESRFQFYEKTKTIIAAPPEVHVIRDLHTSPYQIPNLNNVIITTNYRSGGMYLPNDDRRHFVAYSDLLSGTFDENYWKNFHDWMDAGGLEECAAYLMSRDVSHFNPKASPPRTAAFWAMCEAGENDETADLADLLDGHMAVTIGQLAFLANGNRSLVELLTDGKKGKLINRMLQDLGWVPFRNPNDKRGRWLVAGKRVIIYSHQSLSSEQKLAAAAQFVGRSP